MLWLLLWGMMRLSRFLAGRRIEFPIYELAVIVAVIISSLLVIRLYVYWGVPWHDPSWLADVGRSLVTFTQGVPDEVSYWSPCSSSGGEPSV